MFVGVDPSQRHTGLCFLKGEGAEPSFHEIKTEGLDVLSSMHKLRTDFKSVLVREGVEKGKAVFSVEKQLSVGGQSSSLMFCMQMVVLEVVHEWFPEGNYQVVAPLPIQLTSYIKRIHGIDISSAGSIVRGYQKATGRTKRISQHCVDGYFLARLAIDVCKGEWSYNLPTKEAALVPWSTKNGGKPNTINT